MAETTKLIPRAILSKLARAQDDLSAVREYIEDITLTDEDRKAIKEGREDLKGGKTRRL